MKIQILIILALIFVVSCKCHKSNSSMANDNAKMGETTSILIAKGNLYGSGEEGFTKQNMVIESQSDWEELMTQMNKVNNVSKSFTETKIDFSKNSVIAVFNDVKGSGGHKIELDISETSEHTLVTVNYISPTGIATTAMTQPYYIVKIAKTGLPILFQ